MIYFVYNLCNFQYNKFAIRKKIFYAGACVTISHSENIKFIVSALVTWLHQLLFISYIWLLFIHQHPALSACASSSIIKKITLHRSLLTHRL